MGKIVNIRGTSGSGKSTIARTFLDNLPHEPLPDATGKVKGYRVDATAAGLKEPLYIVGRYESACGGGDTLKSENEAATLCATAQPNGHVLLERMLTSGSGPKGEFASTFLGTGKITYAILDTPLDVCLERVLARRTEREDARPFNPENTNNKYRQTHRAATMLRDAGEDVRDIDHTDAFKAVLRIYLESEKP
jgi:ABC-type dipeptide/oligopeptide/nickel transport system ATPase component